MPYYKTKANYSSLSRFAIFESLFDFSFDFKSKVVDEEVDKKTCLCYHKLSIYEKTFRGFLLILT